jgi:pheromone shutdown protein TraB
MSFECSDVLGSTFESIQADPRVGPDFVECISSSGDVAPIVVAGVVHDHPASVARIQLLAAALEPDVLALELPPAAVELFEQFATDATEGLPDGGEMSAAIRATPKSEVVGIDAPNDAFLDGFVRSFVGGEVTRATASSVVRRTAQLSSHAAACRVASVANRLSLPFPDVAPAIDYECSMSDTPSEQATHERDHLRRTRSLLAATEPPAAQRHFGDLRESAMLDRLDTLRGDRSILAIVGFEHLDTLSEGLKT